MLRSSIVIYTAVFAMIFLGKKLYRHHVTSLVLMVFGIFMGGLSSLTTTIDGQDNSILGIVIVLFA